jgi:hypothetical protein
MPLSQKQTPFQRKDIANATLLTLPVEIRLQIYNLLLVGYVYYEDRRKCEQLVGDGSQDKRWLITFYPLVQQKVLQTCKQIYREANSILYSRNIFYFFTPKYAVRFIKQIGPENLKLVKTLKVTTIKKDVYRLERFLDILVEEANKLRFIKYAWGYDHEYLGELRGPSAKPSLEHAVKEAFKFHHVKANLHLTITE